MCFAHAMHAYIIDRFLPRPRLYRHFLPESVNTGTIFSYIVGCGCQWIHLQAGLCVRFAHVVHVILTGFFFVLALVVIFPPESFMLVTSLLPFSVLGVHSPLHDGVNRLRTFWLSHFHPFVVQIANSLNIPTTSAPNLWYHAICINVTHVVVTFGVFLIYSQLFGFATGRCWCIACVLVLSVRCAFARFMHLFMHTGCVCKCVCVCVCVCVFVCVRMRVFVCVRMRVDVYVRMRVDVCVCVCFHLGCYL